MKTARDGEIVAALVRDLKQGIKNGSEKNGNAESKSVEEFDQAFEKVESALQLHQSVDSTSPSSLGELRNTQLAPIYHLPVHPRLCSRVKMVVPSSRRDPTALDADHGGPLSTADITGRGEIKALPITVQCWSRASGQRKDFLDGLSKHIPRWEIADLSLIKKDLWRISEHPAPHLKYLRLMPVAETEDKEAIDAMKKPHPKDLFQGHMPELEVLIIPYWMQWHEIDYLRLKKLSITHYVGPTPSVRELNKMLLGCPNLETLEISAPVDEVEINDNLSIDLPHLTTDFNYLALSIFLFNLHIPAVQSIELEVDQESLDGAVMDEEDVAFVMMAICPLIEQMAKSSTSNSIDLAEEEGVELTFGVPPGCPGGHSGWLVKLTGFPWMAPMHILTLRCIVFLTRVEDLVANGGNGNHSSSDGFDMVNLIECLPSLETVTLIGHPQSAELLSLLLGAGSRELRRPQEDRSWKNLAHVELEGCVCAKKAAVLSVLKEWKDRRRNKIQRYLPSIGIGIGGCKRCPELRRMMRRLVKEGDHYSDAESGTEDETDSQMYIYSSWQCV
ncbi:hypothetical protein FRB90_005550 [Tulasnella sp. 427]|nr:hypothetical protein FRB90_005550 [Tulasnella sp. 427]